MARNVKLKIEREMKDVIKMEWNKRDECKRCNHKKKIKFIKNGKYYKW